jgi:hypothetical protein
MQIPIELTHDSPELLLRHFKEQSLSHDILRRARRSELAELEVYAFECEVSSSGGIRVKP